MAQHELDRKRQCVLLPDGLSCLVYEDTPVDIRVGGDAKVGLVLLHRVAQVTQVLGDGLRHVGKHARCVVVHGDDRAPKPLQKGLHDGTASTIDCVQTHSELAGLHLVNVDEGEGSNGVDVALTGGVAEGQNTPRGLQHLPRAFLPLLRQRKKRVTLGRGHKQAVAVNELEAVPLNRVVAAGDDNTAVRLLLLYDELDRRGGHNADVEHVVPQAHQEALHEALHPGA
mmetsp:Transcript_14031/g.35848  ORF Transcript_14031/g.35848 Transcript_14031/m.35848 type:complete len:227 (+) Transcript_14031:616-1296(+)